MTVLPTLIAMTLIITCSLYIIVSIQRAFARTASIRHDPRKGGPFVTVRYSVSEPAWPIPAPVQKLSDRTAKVGKSHGNSAQPIYAEAA